MPSIDLKCLDPRLQTQFPSYASAGAAGLDLRAAILEPMTLHADQTQLIPTGIAIYLADATLAGLILPRSGLGHKHGIILGNSVGLIDSDYQGQIFVSLWNRSHVDFLITPLDRIAQLVIIPVVQAQFRQVDTFPSSVRAAGGFGSTGTD